MYKYFTMLAFLFSATVSAEKLLLYYGDPPLSHVEGQATEGLFFDIVTIIFNRMEVEYEIETFPFKRALHYAYNGGGIVVGIGKTNERSQKLDFSKSIYDSTVVAFIRNDKVFHFSSIEDLKGKTVATKLGWSYGTSFDLARKQNLFHTLDGEPESGFRSMLLGRIDVFIDNRLSGIETMKTLKAENETIILPHPIAVFPHYLGFKKNTYTDLIKRFNQHLDGIKSDGTYEKILSKYHYKPTELRSKH